MRWGCDYFLLLTDLFIHYYMLCFNFVNLYIYIYKIKNIYKNLRWEAGKGGQDDRDRYPLKCTTKRQRTGENKEVPISSRRIRGVVLAEESDGCANFDWSIGSCIRYVWEIHGKTLISDLNWKWSRKRPYWKQLDYYETFCPFRDSNKRTSLGP